MQEGLGDRLKTALDDAGITAAELSKRSGISKPAISRYLTNTYTPKQEAISKMAKALNVNMLWLMGFSDIKNIDEENARRKRDLSGQLKELYGKDVLDALNLFLELPSVDQGRIIDRMEIMLANPGAKDLLTSRTSENTARKIPFYYAVSAGTGTYLYDDDCESIAIPVNKKTRKVAYALRVSGNSMEPEYYENDILLVEPAVTLSEGEIGIFNIDGEGYVKRLGKGALESLNKNYDDIKLTDNSSCMGRVIGKL